MNEIKLTWQVSCTDEQAVVTLSGVLNRHTVPDLWQEREQFVLQRQPQLQRCRLLEWDLSAISHIDSAGFALLTELLRLNPPEQVKLVNAPTQCLNLAALFSLKTWLAQYIKQ